MVVCVKPRFRILLLVIVLPSCSFACSDGCAVCFYGTCASCEPGYYGTDCDHTCDENCMTTCLYHRCTSGCVKGYYGDKCQRRCYDCVYGCRQDDGQCKKKYGDMSAKGKPMNFGTVIIVCITVFAVTSILFLVAKCCKMNTKDVNGSDSGNGENYETDDRNDNDDTSSDTSSLHRTGVNRTVPELACLTPVPYPESSHRTDIDGDASDPMLNQSLTGDSQAIPSAPPPPPPPPPPPSYPPLPPHVDAPPTYSSLFPERTNRHANTS